MTGIGRFLLGALLGLGMGYALILILYPSLTHRRKHAGVARIRPAEREPAREEIAA